MARFDAARFPAGSEWAYRRRDDAPSERVRVLKVQARQNSGRADIEFLDDQDPRRTETVPASRLRVPWDQVAAFEELMANWARLYDLDLDETEQAAVEQVYLLLKPDRVAEWEWSPVRFATAVHDRESLAAVLGVSLEDIIARCESFELDGDLMLLRPAACWWPRLRAALPRRRCSTGSLTRRNKSGRRSSAGGGGPAW